MWGEVDRSETTLIDSCDDYFSYSLKRAIFQCDHGLSLSNIFILQSNLSTMKLTAITLGLASTLGLAHAAVQGFDISHYQANVDFQGAYDSGARFVIIKVRFHSQPNPSSFLFPRSSRYPS